MFKRVGKPLRGAYMLRFIGRCAALVISILVYIYAPGQFETLPGMAFFDKVSALHILWAIWVMDMLMQMIPLKRFVPLGSQKLFQLHFRPAVRVQPTEALRAHTKEANQRAGWVALAWTALILMIGVLYNIEILTAEMLFIITVAFYVCDLICVLFWCPFRVFFLKNRCCTTCRIFNWDHLMMFTPMVFLKSFYAWSLIGMAAVVFVCWEVTAYRHPERFWEGTNQALKCGQCTDKLCIKYGSRMPAAKPAKKTAKIHN